MSASGVAATPSGAGVAAPRPRASGPATGAQPAAHGRRSVRLGIRFLGLGYLALLLALPVGLVFYRTFEGGIGPVLTAIRAPAFQHAFWMTVTIALITVPVNTVFGIVTALTLVRKRFPGRGLLNAVIDLPFALSPVVIGLSLVLVYGKNGWFGPALQTLNVQVIFALPGMILATIFVSLPFVVREVIPVLREIGTDQEEAAFTLGASPMRTFWRVTLPAIRWGVIYGVILTTARSLGEFGAVSIVSGRISGKTETLTLYVEERYHEFDLVGAYAAAVVLAILAVAVLLAMNVAQSDRGARARDWVGGLLHSRTRAGHQPASPELNAAPAPNED